MLDELRKTLDRRGLQVIAIFTANAYTRLQNQLCSEFLHQEPRLIQLPAISFSDCVGEPGERDHEEVGQLQGA